MTRMSRSGLTVLAVWLCRLFGRLGWCVDMGWDAGPLRGRLGRLGWCVDRSWLIQFTHGEV